MRTLPIMLALISTLLLTACGFHLRGQNTLELPFQTLYIQSDNVYTPFIAELKRAVQAAGAQITDTPDEAQLTLYIVAEKMDKKILSLSGAGRVREYQLKLYVRYQLVDNKGSVPIPTSEIQLQRIMTYDDSQVIAKQQEEALLYKDMEQDAASQILRRMTAIRRAS